MLNYITRLNVFQTGVMVMAMISVNYYLVTYLFIYVTRLDVEY